MRAHLTDVVVRGLRPVPGKQTKVWDTSTAGFGVLVSERSKSWIVMYGRKRALKVIGRYPTVSLADARSAASTARWTSRASPLGAVSTICLFAGL